MNDHLRARVAGVKRRHIVVVQRGDTLSALSQTHLGSARRWNEIRIRNGLTDDTIHPGQHLDFPADRACLPDSIS
jgi:LysM repeat protein